jgi:novobiocin biosynthesis protein NovU/D-mycarose 3-C-methyltransferase
MPAHTHCRICRTPLPPAFFDLGDMPLANSFLSSPDEFASEECFPLAVASCQNCGLVQLDYVVPAERLYRDYIYVSSTSEGVTAHANALSESLVRQYGWGASDLIVEVASNDGTVLKAFQRRNVRVLGVEPALNIAAIAERDGVPTIAEFFNPASARTVLSGHGRAAGILGRHVFAHVDDVHGFFEAVEACLAPEGVFVVEVPYLADFLEKREFDTIYHEHLSYVSLEPMARLSEMHGFELVDVERGSLHGGVIILHMRRKGVGEPSARLRRMLDTERLLKLSHPSSLQAFVRGVTEWKEKFEALVGGLAASGARFIGYGAAAKANTLLNYCPDVARSLTRILDRSPHKQGRFTPGTHIRVEPAEGWEAFGATHMVVLAWNFHQEIMRQMKGFEDRGGRFIVPIPTPRVV